MCSSTAAAVVPDPLQAASSAAGVLTMEAAAAATWFMSQGSWKQHSWQAQIYLLPLGHEKDITHNTC